ncbi:type II/IV secretion system protein [Candidatus Babeliales bacterium]|nr:type II/IV secretion system protein [Candidatus Babeliales bacterium]
MASGGGIVSLVDSLIETAIERHASDVHLEPSDDGLRVRYRVDGVLYPYTIVSSETMQQVVARVKVLSRINTTEQRIPQDGKFCVTLRGRTIDLRVSTFPTIHGEKVVIRILDRTHTTMDLDQLGFSIGMLSHFHDLITRASGFFLVTGPTGSGKTTTLYAALSEIVTPEKNVVTLEDPVEYDVDGTTQGQVHPEVGFTFEKGIRAILRQDPDVVMIGEIRDKQTARIGIEAALTGHLVFSTLHTTDAPGALVRLLDMGIEPFLLNAAVTGVLAQRLVRTICPLCKTEMRPRPQDRLIMERIGLYATTLYKGAGCDACFMLGYRGRTGIFELLLMSHALGDLVVHQPRYHELQQQARQEGMKTLLDDAKHKVIEGTITLNELARVLL